MSFFFVLVIFIYCSGNVNAELGSEFKVWSQNAANSSSLTDLIIIEGDSWQKFLSIIPVTSRLSSLPPILFFKEENWPYIKDFNTRPGLSIQTANSAGLIPRLQAIAQLDLKNKTAEERIKFISNNNLTCNK